MSNNSNKKIENEAAEIQSLIKDTERFISVFILTVIQAILNEQQKARTLDKKTANYIYSAVLDQCRRKGWID